MLFFQLKFNSSMDFIGYNSFERASLINELTHGVEAAKQLKVQMGPEYSVENKEMLLQQMIASYDKALFILGCGVVSEPPHQLLPMSSLAMPSTPLSAMESSKSDDLYAALRSHQDAKGHSKKRKAKSNCIKQVKVNCGSIHDVPPSDGYSWRKYGQKDILGSKHSRSYYRCTYRSVQDCWATKQVQRSDDDPTVLNITYKEKHTCNMPRRSKSAPTSPGKQEHKSVVDLPITEYHTDSNMALNFQNTISADAQNIDSFLFSPTPVENPSVPPSTINLTSEFYGSIPQSLISQETSGSNFFLTSPSTMDTFASVQHTEQNFERDITEILSAATSVTNSPAIDPDFSLDSWSYGLNFQFNNL
uniref:WRKY transcription factor n=1 Tax=Fagopyrum tataricum TaxID=62330 RepID=A0A4P9Q293_FAGTA|nr:WRKY transcription factor [Fagopyrum tataricum]QGT76435.1 WRKY46 [Fagopyrum tataricum]